MARCGRFDHLLPFNGADDRPAFETLTTLGAMALLTSRARIGVLVNGVLYRDPAVLAKASAQVDEMSLGRLDFSLGAAWAEREFRAYGMPFPTFAERYARLDEALADRQSAVGAAPDHVQGPLLPAGRRALRAQAGPVAAPADHGWWFGFRDRCGWRPATLTASTSWGRRQNAPGRFEKLEEICSQVGRDFNEIELSAAPVRGGSPDPRRSGGDGQAGDSGQPDRFRCRSRQLGDR